MVRSCIEGFPEGILTVKRRPQHLAMSHKTYRVLDDRDVHRYSRYVHSLDSLDPLGVADKPVGVNVLEGAGFGELVHLLFVEFPAARAEVVLELLYRAGADDGRGDALLPEEPVEGDLGVGLAGRLAYLADDVEDGPVALGGAAVPVLLHRLHGLGDARASRRFFAAAVLAGEEGATQRAPRDHAEPLLPADRQDAAASAGLQ